MSRCYWGITGYGICLNDIAKYLNKEKVVGYLKRISPNQTIDEDPFENDTFYGNPYNSFVEFLLEFDEKNILDYESDGQDAEYLLYTPPYPWTATKNEPKSLNELKDYIYSILRKVYDASADILYDAMYYVDTAGCS